MSINPQHISPQSPETSRNCDRMLDEELLQEIESLQRIVNGVNNRLSKLREKLTAGKN